MQITFFKSKEKGKVKSKEKSKEKILETIRTNPNITTIGLIEVTGLTASGVEKNIRILKQQGLLERIGSGKSGYWKLAGERSWNAICLKLAYAIVFPRYSRDINPPLQTHSSTEAFNSSDDSRSSYE